MDDQTFLHELAPVAEQLLERHLNTAKEWFPHLYVPWSRGRDFAPDEEWQESSLSPSPAVRSALLVNLLTEDNLPYYFQHIDHTFGPEHPWSEWVRRWTAEEMRHAIVIRDYLTVTRSIDLVALERARMHQVAGGVAPQPGSVGECIVYVALQELATRISHWNTGKLLDDPAGYEVMARVAKDENLHYLFYRDLTSAAIELDPSTMMIAIAQQVLGFQMPGTGIVDFATHARLIAAAGIYDFEVHHDQILVPVLFRHWSIDTREGLTPEAEEAREKILRHVERMGRAARRLASRRQEPPTHGEEAATLASKQTGPTTPEVAL